MQSLQQLEEKVFSEYTAKNVKIGIIDSGIDKENSVLLKKSIGGGTIHERNGYLSFVEGEIYDCIGHGTAIGSIIASKAPEAELVVIRIFEDNLVTSKEKLVYAIQKCIDYGCHIINISAGIKEYNNKLEDVCKIACSKNIKIIAACSNDELPDFYPAYLECCYGVQSGSCHGRFDYYFSRQRNAQFIARGDPQRLRWLSGQQVFMGGASFAAAHVTAFVALLSQEFANYTKEEFDEILQRFSLTQMPEIIQNQQYSLFSPQIVTNKDREFVKSQLNFAKTDFIKKALVIGSEANIFFEKGTETTFDLVGVVKDTNFNNLEILNKDFDTVIICSETNTANAINFENEVLAWGKNVFYLTPSAKRIKMRQENGYDVPAGLRIIEPQYDTEIYLNQISKCPQVLKHKVKAPILGIVAPAADNDLRCFTLKLTDEFRSLGYNISTLETSAYSPLYGGNFACCCSGPDQLQSDYSKYAPMFRFFTQALDYIYTPDLILITGQVPLVKQAVPDNDRNSLLRSLAFLFGALIEGYILISPYDDNSIEKNIQAVAKGKIIEKIKEFSDVENIARKVINYFT